MVLLIQISIFIKKKKNEISICSFFFGNAIISWLLGPAPVADVRSLTHYGEPYDGNTRYFRSTLFVAATRSCYGESSLLHGVEWMPPKVSLLLI